MTKLQKCKLEQAQKMLENAIDLILDVYANADPEVDFPGNSFEILKMLAENSDDFAANASWNLLELTT